MFYLCIKGFPVSPKVLQRYIYYVPFSLLFLYIFFCHWKQAHITHSQRSSLHVVFFQNKNQFLFCPQDGAHSYTYKLTLSTSFPMLEKEARLVIRRRQRRNVVAPGDVTAACAALRASFSLPLRTSCLTAQQPTGIGVSSEKKSAQTTSPDRRPPHPPLPASDPAISSPDFKILKCKFTLLFVY